jgi:hypothetical protein
MGFKIPLLGAQWWFAVTLVLVVVMALSLTITTSYNRDNYRYVLSAELQSVAAVFALVVTGTLVAAQIAVGTTPRIISYLPLRAFMLAVTVNVATMGVDVVALARLPDSATWMGRLFVNFAAVLNGEALLFTLAYVGASLVWTQPKIHLAALLNRMAQADDLQSERDIVLALEELGLYAGERRHIQTCDEVIHGVVAAARILVENPNLRIDEVLQDREHPLVLLPRTLGHLGEAWARDGLDRPVSTIASALGAMALGYSQHDDRLVDADFPIAMEDTMRSCVRHSREIALYNFLANKRDALIRLIEASAQRAVEFWRALIYHEIDMCADSHLVDAARLVISELDVLVGDAAAHKTDADSVAGLVTFAEDRFTPMSDRVAMFEEATLGDALQATRDLLDELKDHGK